MATRPSSSTWTCARSPSYLYSTVNSMPTNLSSTCTARAGSRQLTRQTRPCIFSSCVFDRELDADKIVQHLHGTSTESSAHTPDTAVHRLQLRPSMTQHIMT